MVPIIERHKGIYVVRDDLYPGGTKARIFKYLYSLHGEIVYACAAFSRTQVSLARVAKELNKKATIFIPKRAVWTKESLMAKEAGASIYEIKPGYLSVIQKRAREYAFINGAYFAPLGFDTSEIIKQLAEEIKQTPMTPAEVWCAAGSGVLTRALQQAWPEADHNAVLVGKNCNIGKAKQYRYPAELEEEYEFSVPFSTDRHYDAKAWSFCVGYHDLQKSVLFWNVLGD